MYRKRAIKVEKVLKTFGKYEGSYTIEISLIMPIVLGVILVCIYLCLFVHDRTVMEYACTKALLEAERLPKEMSNADLTDIIDYELQKGLVGKWNYVVSSQYEEDCVEIVLKGKMGVSQKLLYIVADVDLFDIEVHRKGIINMFSQN